MSNVGNPVPRRGEHNTSTNVGAGEGLAKAKEGINLPFKSLTAGAAIILTGNTNDVEIAVDILDEDNMTSNSATLPPSQQSVVAYIAAQLAALASGMSPQGNYDASTDTPSLDTTPSGILLGYTYFVSVAGTFFTEDVEAGDTLIAKQDDPTTLAHWIILQNNQTPASIKTAYESNANTNELNDADAAKLSVLYTKGADIASASALTIGTDGDYFDVTGTTTITSINTLGVGYSIKLHFDGILTLTHHATDLILPTGADIATAAGDEAVFIEYASGDWRCVNYQRADGTALAGSGGGLLISSATGTDNIGTESIGAFAAIAAGAQYNIAIGHGVLAALTSGDKNVGVGNGSLDLVTTSSDNTALGYDSGNAITTGAGNTIIGSGADAASGTAQAVAVGYNAIASGNFSVMLGAQSTASGTASIAIGYDTNTNSHANSIVIGRGGDATAANQFTLGGNSYEINDIRLGEGGSTSSPQTDITMQATPASGSNLTGTNFLIRGGLNTGTGTPGSLKFQVGTTMGSGSTLGTVQTHLEIREAGIFAFNLPTSDPSVTGQLYLSGSTLMVSA